MLGIAQFAIAQTSVLHLHEETDPSTGDYLLKSAPPDAPAKILSWDVTNQTGYVAGPQFVTESPMTISKTDTLSVEVWGAETYDKTSNVFLSVILEALNADTGLMTGFCGWSGYEHSLPLTSTLTAYSFSCTAGMNISNSPVYMYVGAYIYPRVVRKTVSAEIAIEGSAFGNYDSYVDLWLSPIISSLNPSSGSVGTSVSITGSNFGSIQGSITFGGSNAVVSSWTDSTINAVVPSGLSLGSVPVVVTASNGLASNSVNFTVSPVISGLSPSSGSIGTSVTIVGSTFGSSQGNSTVTFNGTTATPASWSDTAINVPVPGNASSGPVVVTVNGVNSNEVPFTVLGGAINGTATDAGNGNAISGVSVEVVQSNTVVASTATATDGTFSISNLSTGSYDIRFSASGYGTTIVPGNFVTSGTSVTVNATLSLPGTIAGQVTQADGSTPIAAATVSAVQGGSSTASTTTDSSGGYSLPTLSVGTYTVLASAAGYQAKSSGGVSVTAGSTTTQNFSLTTENQSAISYFYDELGRIIGASDAQGNTADYAYDSVGNLLSISVNPSSQVSIVGFDPESGPVGATVTISGTGFSPTASEDSVSFNGTAATVTSASTTQIVATVPTGATTGPIVVTTPNGTATSNSSFTVQ